MGIAITPEQRELAEAVRGWIARAVPPEEVRKLLDAPGGGRPPFWDALAAQGLLAAHLPEAYGGGGGDLVDLAVVVEEAARAALPGPFVANVLASAVLTAEVAGGTGDAVRAAGRGDLVRALGRGERIGAVAFGAGSLTARAADGGYVLDGTAPPVLSGADADVLVLAASCDGGTMSGDGAAARGAAGSRPGAEAGADLSSDGAAPSGRGGSSGRDTVSRGETAAGGGVASGDGTASHGDTASGGVLWLVVDAADLVVRAHESADPTRATAEVRAEGVRVPADRVLAVDPSLVRDLAAVVLAADACGTAAWALDTAAGHAKVREQFGRPIGRFQGVKHLCADMLVRLEQARALTWDAARAGQEPSGAGQEPSGVRELVASLAAGAALDAACSCAKDCVQILGGIGFTWEHDAHLYLRRALVARQLLGAGGGHLRRAARLARGGVRRELRLELPPEADVFRAEARRVTDRVRGLDPAAVRRSLAPTGHAAPHLPPPYGLGAGPVQQLALQQELAAAGVRISDLGIATWVVPSLIAYGTGTQRERYLLPTLRGDLLWCQLFSEPGAGSDLASLRTRAERTPDGRWRINGQKVWTSAAQWADHGILLARTNPAAPKHKGLTYFVVDMKNTRGIDIRPLKEITGDSLFNEVYFDDVLLPADAVVGEVDDGWRVARNTLGNERVHMADQLTFDTGLEALISADADDSRLGALLAEAHALACIGLRTTLRQVSGVEPGAGASVRKLVQTAHQQKVAELALELLGPAGALREGPGERAVHGFLLSRCLTIAGGTTQVQLNVVAERILGLPRD
ncbi:MULTISPECIES: acyl-CoA dehydrogenase [unclassified Streptomyces]|uniref:acyl-CoA dehydrogenase n=1 Tax=unclassified Streptomyces TaxID=2593676 RepID=UPI00225978D7|nr:MULTISPECIES: acyl-CoA dehydrogenase [unclassified Streptomyces]MCX4991280.1 acyl-CoA dehydrogenase [Streptomyces sp. NBC_00568]MCX5003483.1 acyl-CoA dehydrogenase [Streptomyces sp. NBC_00638]